MEGRFGIQPKLASGWDDLFKPASQLGYHNKKCLPKDAGGLDGATVDTANPSPWLQMARWRARLHIRAPSAIT